VNVRQQGFHGVNIQIWQHFLYYARNVTCDTANGVPIHFPRPLKELLQQAKDHSDEQLFGTTKYTDNWLVQCQTAIWKALQFFGYGFDIDSFQQELAQTICNLPLPNVVILWPGEALNKK
jgi:hypothetical protein